MTVFPAELFISITLLTAMNTVWFFIEKNMDSSVSQVCHAVNHFSIDEVVVRYNSHDLTCVYELFEKLVNGVKQIIF